MGSKKLITDFLSGKDREIFESFKKGGWSDINGIKLMTISLYSAVWRCNRSDGIQISEYVKAADDKYGRLEVVERVK
jgi:hypothetical protein